MCFLKTTNIPIVDHYHQPTDQLNINLTPTTKQLIINPLHQPPTDQPTNQPTNHQPIKTGNMYIYVYILYIEIYIYNIYIYNKHE